MRSLFLLAALPLAASVHAADPDAYRIRNAADLVYICSTPSSAPDHATATAFCHGVLAGAYNYYAASTAEADRFVCVPDPAPTRSKVAGDFVAWANARPQFMKSGAIDTLFRFAAEAFPCRK
ncbi:MAG: Rap1a/Tai family immunity protein [Burkholderiales bacterium]|nr:Rap1a/Tai family immunity protein [Burkholderiales bacterium]